MNKTKFSLDDILYLSNGAIINYRNNSLIKLRVISLEATSRSYGVNDNMRKTLNQDLKIDYISPPTSKNVRLITHVHQVWTYDKKDLEIPEDTNDFLKRYLYTEDFSSDSIKFEIKNLYKFSNPYEYEGESIF